MKFIDVCFDYLTGTWIDWKIRRVFRKIRNKRRRESNRFFYLP